MSEEELKDRILHAYDESINKGNMSALDDIFAEDMVDHSIAAASGEVGLNGFKNRIKDHRIGLPDLVFTIENMIMEGDKLAFHWTFCGTQSGPWMGQPPTDIPLKMSGMNMERLFNDRIVEHWSYPDIMGAMAQIGFFPGSGHRGL